MCMTQGIIYTLYIIYIYILHYIYNLYIMGDKIAPKIPKYPPHPPNLPPQAVPPPSHRNNWGPVGTPTAGFFYVQNYLKFYHLYLFEHDSHTLRYFFYGFKHCICVFDAISGDTLRVISTARSSLVGLRLRAATVLRTRIY